MPTDMTRYPANWGSEIRPRILARAKGRCERCGALNGEIGHRDEWGRFHGCYACERGTGGGCGERAIRIVLTIAHLADPDPMNCADENLAALCQRCHNRLDAPMRRAHAAETRRRRRVSAGQPELALGGEAAGPGEVAL